MEEVLYMIETLQKYHMTSVEVKLKKENFDKFVTRSKVDHDLKTGNYFYVVVRKYTDVEDVSDLYLEDGKILFRGELEFDEDTPILDVIRDKMIERQKEGLKAMGIIEKEPKFDEDAPLLDKINDRMLVQYAEELKEIDIIKEYYNE